MYPVWRLHPFLPVRCDRFQDLHGRCDPPDQRRQKGRSDAGTGDRRPVWTGHHVCKLENSFKEDWICRYDRGWSGSTEKVLFSADGFGKFGALDAEEPWDDEARRYFIGIVGKYGKQVQALLKVAATLDIQKICPLHGPVLTEDLGHYIGLYDTWSSYTPEADGIVIAYTSVYGHTRDAVYLLAEKLKSKGCPRVLVYDLARDDMSQAISDAFRYSKLVLATTTYNASIYPFMNDFITRLVEHNFQNRTVGIIENGSWAPLAAKVMKEMMAPCKKIDWLKNNVHIWSAVKEENRKEIEAMTDELCKEYIAKSDTLDKQK